jgi:hypothetical protein
VGPALCGPEAAVPGRPGYPGDEAEMTKADDKKIQALAKKNAAKIVKPKDGSTPNYDDTLRIKKEEEKDARGLFKEMKKREF